jgi:hypothetical protein
MSKGVDYMLNRILIDETNKDFAKAAQIVEENGSVVIIVNNQQYILQKYNNDETDTGKIVDSAILSDKEKKVVTRNIEAFKELAK